MDIAEAVSARSHDAETKVGSLLIKKESGAIVATGFNGFVRNAPDNKLPTTRPDKYTFICHAEANLIYNAARHGIAMDNTFVVCTMTPCAACMRALWNCGVTEVIAKEKYKDLQSLLSMPDLSIDLSVTNEGYYHLIYKNS